MEDSSNTSEQEQVSWAEKYERYARKVACSLIRKFGLPESEREDILQAAYLGLVDAATRFDPSRGNDFRTFAFSRIRGSILDYVRKNAHESNYRSDVLRELGLWDSMRGGVGWVFKESELNDEVSRIARLLEMTSTAALFVSLTSDTIDTRGLQCKQLNPEENANLSLFSDKFKAALQSLPARERRVIECHYYKGMSLKEIGVEFGSRSKSWISRLHTQGIRRLKKIMLNQNALTRIAQEEN